MLSRKTSLNNRGKPFQVLLQSNRSQKLNYVRSKALFVYIHESLKYLRPLLFGISLSDATYVLLHSGFRGFFRKFFHSSVLYFQDYIIVNIIPIPEEKCIIKIITIVILVIIIILNRKKINKQKLKSTWNGFTQENMK